MLSTLDEYARERGLSRNTAQSYLSRLHRRGAVVRHRTARGTYYEVLPVEVGPGWGLGVLRSYNRTVAPVFPRVMEFTLGRGCVPPEEQLPALVLRGREEGNSRFTAFAALLFSRLRDPREMVRLARAYGVAGEVHSLYLLARQTLPRVPRIDARLTRRLGRADIGIGPADLLGAHRLARSLGRW